jgi:DNA-binding transcriptional LysR family regulator
VLEAFTRRAGVPSLTVAFDEGLPHARWGPLFHVFRLERSDVVLSWRAVGFPAGERSLLEDADVGIFVQPREETGMDMFTLDASPMVALVAAGHRLADRSELIVADLIDERFPGGSGIVADWTSFWTLDEQRGAPPKRSEDHVTSAERGLEIVAAGRAITTVPVWLANCVTHPGVIALPISDGPRVVTRLVWRADDDNPAVRGLVDLARAWTPDDRGNGGPGAGR